MVILETIKDVAKDVFEKKEKFEYYMIYINFNKNILNHTIFIKTQKLEKIKLIKLLQKEYPSFLQIEVLQIYPLMNETGASVSQTGKIKVYKGEKIFMYDRNTKISDIKSLQEKPEVLISIIVIFLVFLSGFVAGALTILKYFGII